MNEVSRIEERETQRTDGTSVYQQNPHPHYPQPTPKPFSDKHRIDPIRVEDLGIPCDSERPRKPSCKGIEINNLKIRTSGCLSDKRLNQCPLRKMWELPYRILINLVT